MDEHTRDKSESKRIALKDCGFDSRPDTNLIV